MQNKWKECHVCGGDSYRIQMDNTMICADCGTRVGWYSDYEVPPSHFINKPDLEACYMDVFEGRRPTEAELNLLVGELTSGSFSKIAEMITDAIRDLKEKGKLPHEST
jgi:hypothetical protein